MLDAFMANAVEIEGMILENEPGILSSFLLAFFNAGVRKFNDLTAFDADNMIMMISIIELKNRSAALKVMTDHET